MNKYILITSAKNEEKYIEKTINSVIKQTILPEKWFIVNDGSTDRTEEIIRDYLSSHKFIVLLNKEGSNIRNFGSKARSVMFAYQKIRNIDVEFVGNLDADVSFDEKYYENIMNEFKLNSKLGIAGGLRYDLVNDRFIPLKTAPDSVGGPYQFFRKECFESVGGYKPLRFGGIDAVAEITARMNGWQVKHFPEYKIYHYRVTGFANNNLIQHRFKIGLKNYSIGYHPLFFSLKLFNKDFRKPYFLGSILILSGYIWGAFRRYKLPISKEFKKYLRSEQVTKIKLALISPLFGKIF